MVHRFVIDTTIFVNPEARAAFGSSPNAAVRKFVRIAKSLPNVEFFIPPSIFNELKNFIDEKTAAQLELYVKKRAPNLFAIYLPAAVLHDFIDEVRVRINKGLRLAEQFARDNRPDNDEKLGRLREKYREAMRAGLIDSTEDFDLILLAKEIDAAIVSSDEGVLQFANKIGCEWLNGGRFYELLQKLK